ncbi:sugar ABC transporter substrate-binding protein [Bacillus suaedae]|uniref:Substrate-binding domain-containing protein n=1 Tax=Halalkalibacter suaedae TaxID=2822140 RepID=A0A941AU09_9BACI|nr:substrate-binding domain-containing protein [Bacillus suaedae]MBP3953234.1 substrate-binding domain-containing protein [Bacillus suaedae]
MSSKNKANRLLLLLSTLLLLVLGACNTESASDSNEDTDQKLRSNPDQIYVGFVLDTLREERWYRDKEAFEGAVRELGAEVKTLAANGNQQVQIQQAQLLINEGVDVLVVVPTDADGASEIVTLAHAAGVKVISYDRLIRGADLDYYLSFDNVKVGELQAQEIVNRVDQGTFAYVGGSETDNNAILFREGAMNVLKPFIDSGAINLVYDNYTENWEPERARDQLASFLASNSVQLDAVVAANDGTAGGVVEALGARAGEVEVSGQDAELAGVRRVAEGTQTMTVYKSIVLIAERAAELAIQVASGEEITTESTVNNGQADIPSILLEPIAVTAENIRETIIKEGHLSESDIYGE